jgi:uncharacterized glyoxalase superfamily protein PhnB
MSEDGAIIPYLTVADSAAAIDFYARAFGAVERLRMPGPGGRGVLHAEIVFPGGAVLFLGDPGPAPGGPGAPGAAPVPVSLFRHVPDVDATMKRAVEAGATVTAPAADMFWGDRFGKLRDPFGHSWMLATKLREMSAGEMKAAAAAAFAKPPA